MRSLHRKNIMVAHNFAADDNQFLDASADYYLDEPQYLQPVDPVDIQDQYLNNVLGQCEPNQPQIYHEMQPASVPAPTTTKKTSRFFHVTESHADTIEENNYKDKTKKQTVWGVKIFRGTFQSVHN